MQTFSGESWFRGRNRGYRDLSDRRQCDREHQGFQSRDQQGDGKARYGAVAVKKDGDCSAVCLIPQGSADWEEWAVMDDESSSGRFPTLLFPQWLVCAN